MTARTPVLVTVERWRHPVLGDRYTLVADDRVIATRATRAEVEAVAREYGWRIEERIDG